MELTASVADYVKAQPTLAVGSVAFIALLIWSIKIYWHLSHIPGPFLANFTNLPRVFWVLSYRAHEKHIEQHRKYGPIVRFGPTMVSVGAPSEISTIYRFSKPWPKSEFYRALLMKPNGKPIPGIFATQDEKIHHMLKKPVSNAYSMTTLLSFEPYVDTTSEVFCRELTNRFATTGQSFDLGVWLQMYAFDVIGELTFSRRLGFLESGTDVNGVMKNIWDMFKETSLVTQMPWIDDFWTNSPIRRYMRGQGVSPGAAFAMARVQERREEVKAGKTDWDRETRDFMSRFLEVEAKDNTLPPYAIAAWASSNITAGSDTTGILLRSIFYYLLSNPSSLARLRVELSAASDALGPMSSWRQSRELPYLDAIIKEAGRLNPSFGLPYERVVPSGGATICGRYLPEGTVVGMSAFVVHHDPEVFGEDCDQWRPERWLECGEDGRRKMESSLLTFGAGHRSCLGKNIAYLEVYKVVPTLLYHFDFQLLGPEEGGRWKVKNRWLAMPEGLMVRIQRRDS